MQLEMPVTMPHFVHTIYQPTNRYLSKIPVKNGLHQGLGHLLIELAPSPDPCPTKQETGASQRQKNVFTMSLPTHQARPGETSKKTVVWLETLYQSQRERDTIIFPVTNFTGVNTNLNRFIY